MCKNLILKKKKPAKEQFFSVQIDKYRTFPKESVINITVTFFNEKKCMNLANSTLIFMYFVLN